MQQLIQNIPNHWRQTLASLLMVSLLSFIIFYQSWFSIVEIWYRSDIYTHGFVIIPICLWLVWTQRDYLINLYPQINWKVSFVVLASGFLWLLADLTHVQVVKQFATVALLVASLWLVLGNQVAKSLLFPLFFLFLMVPMGEELVPTLMEFTASFTVGLIRLTGMSVYREGLHFTLVSGSWSVVQACSGISYLISSITLGIVYAYLTYQKTWKRCLFILVSIIIPVVANGVRAYLIVMIGHFSGMTLAVGIDHLIYGGLFFGLVMLILFYIGSFWKDTREVAVKFDRKIVLADESVEFKNKPSSIIVFTLVMALTFGIWPAGSFVLSNQQNETTIAQNFSRLDDAGWKQTEAPGWQWRADFKNVAYQSTHYFGKQDNVVGLYQAGFGKESQGGGELVNSQNLLLSDENEHWKIVNQGKLKIESLNDSFMADETILRGASSDLLLLSWYSVGGINTANNYVAKLLQLKKRLLLDSTAEYINVVIIQTPKNHYEVAREQILQWLKIWLS